jgi:hypothetical protein
MIDKQTQPAVSDDDALKALGVTPKLTRPLRMVTTTALAVAGEGPMLSVLLGAA